jgi:DNA-binding CsgD family transcriptional regulator
MAGRRAELSQAVAQLGGDLDRAFGELLVPAVVIDARGTIRWQNAAVTGRFGEVLGHHFTKLLAPESMNVGRTEFARQLLGVERTSGREATFITRTGERLQADVSTVALEGTDRRVVGVFGLAAPRSSPRKVWPLREDLSPRQAEVLAELARGRSTGQIAGDLGIATETVRNHIRYVLRKLGVHSRLEAVAEARRRGLVN